MSSKSWRSRMAKLQSMSAAEARERGLQEVHKRLDLLRFHLSARSSPRISLNSAASSGSFFFYPHQVPEILRLLRDRFPEQVTEVITRAEKIRAHKFDLLGYQNLDYGPEIDWHLDRVHGKRAPRKPWHKIRYLDFNEVGDVKVTWELNRHQHLVTLAKAYRLTGDDRLAQDLFRQWYHWIEHNPHPIGINWASSLEVAFRSLSWLWVKHLMAGTPVVPMSFAADLRQALAVHGRHIERYLSTFFSPNTHLLGEGVALFFIGTLCPELPQSERWKQLGWKIVLEEAERQVRPDGLHFEQSSYYHVYALDFFLHAVLLASRNDIEIPEFFERKIEQMLEVLWSLSRSGITHEFGDDDGGRLFDPQRNRAEHLADPLATGAVLFERSEFKAVAVTLREETVWLLGAEGAARFDHLAPAPVMPSSTAFEDSGLYIMAAASRHPAQLLIDAGPHGAHTAGHGHSDALSLQLAQDGRMLLIDPGTCEYVGDGPERARFRGTAAHNTMQVDGLEQSSPRGPFSWNNLAETEVHCWVRGESFDLFAGSHDGYRRLESPVAHRRWVFFCKPDFWLVRDVAEGAGHHHLAVNWHFAPGMVPGNPGMFAVPGLQSGVGLITPQDSIWSMKLVSGERSPAYARKETAPIVRFECDADLPVELAAIIHPAAASAAVGTLVPLHETREPRSVIGYAYTVEQMTHRFFFATGAGTWTFGDWSSDADFFYCHETPFGFESFVLCNASHLSLKGEPVLTARHRTSHCELRRSASGTIISPENPSTIVHRWPQSTPDSKSARLEPEPARMGR